MKLQKVLRELRRGVAITRAGGWSAGWALVREEGLRNGWIRLRASTGSSGARSVECNLCGWRGPSFLTHCAVGYVDRNAFCPRCRSYPRHRGFAWLLEQQIGAQLARLARVPGLRLVFAPEPGMLRLLSRWVTDLEGVDIVAVNEHVKHLADLQALPFPDGSVAFVSCFHVLEHVPDDARALRELARALHPDGLMVLCVPLTIGKPATEAFGGPNPLWNDHCFDYGEDFPERLERAGLSGSGYRLHELVPRELHERLALSADIVYLLRRTPPDAHSRVLYAGAATASELGGKDG